MSRRATASTAGISTRSTGRRTSCTASRISACRSGLTAKDELFIAERGKGAFLNNRRIRVSARIDPVDSLVATGIPTLGRKDHPAFIRQLSIAMLRAGGVRRLGAAALDLAYVACGRYDGYWEQGLFSWDMAAGALMVREAGGFVTDGTGKEEVLGCDTIVAGNEAIHKAVLGWLKEARVAT